MKLKNMEKHRTGSLPISTRLNTFRSRTNTFNEFKTLTTSQKEPMKGLIRSLPTNIGEDVAENILKVNLNPTSVDNLPT